MITRPFFDEAYYCENGEVKVVFNACSTDKDKYVRNVIARLGYQSYNDWLRIYGPGVNGIIIRVYYKNIVR